MKTCLTPRCALLWLLLVGGAVNVPAALTHRWSFNETSGTNFADSIGGLNASVVVSNGGGGYTLTGSAVRLDGGTRATADYVSIPAAAFSGLTNATIEIWATPHSFPNWGRLIEIGEGDATPNPTTNNFRLSWSIALDGNQQRFGLRPFAQSDSALVTAVGQMYHYAIVWTTNGGPGGQAQISWYRDGNFITNQNVGTATIGFLNNLANRAVWLGRSSFPADDSANASYQEMRIYNHALTPAEIALNTLKGPDNTGPNGVDGLQHRWSFSETNGSTLADSVGAATGQIVRPGGGGGAGVVTNGQLRLFGGAKGTSDYAAFPGGLLNGLNDVTIEAWATPVSAMNWSRIWDFGSGVDNANTWFLSFVQGTAINQQRMEFVPYTINTALATALNQQYHYVGVWSTNGGTAGGGRMAWYRDGVLAGEIDTGTTTPAAVNDDAFWLGRSSWPDDTANAFFNELRIYNRALTPAEINYSRLNGPDNVTIPPVNTVADTATLNPGAKVLINVLANDTGAAANPASVQVLAAPAHGSAVVKPDGKIIYTHNGDPGASDSFTYRAANYAGSNSAVAAVTLTITNALRLAATSLTLPPAAPPASYGFVEAFPGLVFEDAMAIATPPGRTNQIFVVERRGRISYIPDINAATPQRIVMMDIVNQMAFDDTAQGELGLQSMAFHPGFATNGFFYVFYTAPGSPYFDRLSRFTANPNTLTVDTNTQVRLFDVVDQVFNHNGGDLHFGTDGYLYIGLGDEGDQYNFRQNAQRIDKDLFSALLRIDVDKRPGNREPKPSANTTTIYTNASGLAFYSIPADNPFVSATNFLGSPINTNQLRAEIFAPGFRHIWRFSIDEPTGEIWVGDVGQDSYEEIDIVTNGGNYGWAYNEGFSNTIALYPTQTTLLSNPPPSYVPVPPLYSYPHTGLAGDPQFKGNSVTGGFVYRGSKIPELYGAYIFGDFVSTHVWALWRTNNSVRVERLGGIVAAAGFGRDPGNGDVLVANYVMNRIDRLVRVGASDTGFPQKLSDTGAFADLTDLSPNPGLVNYDPIVPFWSDNAIKRRWFGIPNLTDTVTHVTDGNWTLPAGMVWVKHFDIDYERGNPATRHRLETRFLVKTTNSVYGVSYAWNAAGTEAFLVPDGGTNFNLTITNGLTTVVQPWGIPSRSECLACHTTVGGQALSYNTRQLNQTATMNGQTGNQLSLLSAAGYFANAVPAPQTLPAFSRANDAAISLEHRVRSYLAVNCVQCHQPGGTGPSSWDARAWLSLDATSLLYGAPNNNAGNPLNQFVVPGDPAHSVILQRIRANGFSRMPPLATAVIDEAATNLLHAWISTELTNRQTFAQWQLANFGSTNSANALAASDPDGDGANNFYEYLTQTSPTNALPAPWTITIDQATGTVAVRFQRLANLGFLVETSPNFASWQTWNVPSNRLWFSATNFPDTITGPLAATNQFFRVRIFEP
ncbi:MAG: LamG-like jellyroll fold domain-containing protein [Verrucomicrobiota bacterium]